MPSQVDTQSQDGQRAPHEATAPTGSEDEAISAFNRRAQSQAQTESDQPNDEPQDDDPAPEPEEGDPEEIVDAADDLVEVEYEGETHKLPPKLKDALLRQADYSRNIQQLAATKKDYAQRVESFDKLLEGAEQLAEVKAEAKQLDAQIKQFENVDWIALRRDDPARASLLAVDLMSIQQARMNLTSKEQSLASEMAAGRQKDLSAKQAEMLKVLAKDFPGWGDAAGQKVTEYALKSGYGAEEIRSFSDPRLVLALEKARKFDAIQDGKNKALSQTREAQPVARPGAPRRATPVADVEKRFQRSTSPDDAVAVFEARAGQRKR